MQGNTIQQLLADRIETFATGDKPTEIIDKAVEKLFKELIDESFKSWGDFGTAVKASVKAAMPSNVSDMFELTRYNSLIINSLRERWQASTIGDDFLRRANAALDEVLREDAIPAQVRLSELLEAFVESHAEDAAEKGWDRPHVRIKEDEGIVSARFIHIAFDEEPEEDYLSGRSLSRLTQSRREDHQFKNRVSVNVLGETDDSHPFGRVYHARLEGQPVGRDFSIRNRWERLLAALYFGVADLIIDCDEYDVSYPGRD